MRKQFHKNILYDYDFVCFYYISDLSIVIGFCQTETSVKIVKSFIIQAIINKEKLELAGCYLNQQFIIAPYTETNFFKE